MHLLVISITFIGINFGSIQNDISVNFKFSSASLPIDKLLQNHTSILVDAPSGIGANLTFTINVIGVMGTSNYSYQGTNTCYQFFQYLLSFQIIAPNITSGDYEPSSGEFTLTGRKTNLDRRTEENKEAERRGRGGRVLVENERRK